MPVILDRPGGEEHKQRLTQIFNAIEAYALTDTGSTVLQGYAQAILIDTCVPGAVEPSDNPIKEFIEIINDDLGDAHTITPETIEQHQTLFQTTVALTIMEALIQHLNPDQLLSSKENVLEHASQLIANDQMTIQAESPFFEDSVNIRSTEYDRVRKGEIPEWIGFPMVAESINTFFQSYPSLSNSLKEIALRTFMRVRMIGDADSPVSIKPPLRKLYAKAQVPLPATRR